MKKLILLTGIFLGTYLLFPKGTGAIETAIGTIDVSNPTGFITSILDLAIGVAGGIAFLLMIFGVFQIITSSGSPEKIAAGQQLITSAIAGLLVIVFSIFILRLIGQDVLGLFS